MPLLQWIEEVRSICGPSIPVILVACKTDLRDKAIQNGTYSPDTFIDAEVVSICLAPTAFQSPPPRAEFAREQSMPACLGEGECLADASPRAVGWHSPSAHAHTTRRRPCSIKVSTPCSRRLRVQQWSSATRAMAVSAVKTSASTVPDAVRRTTTKRWDAAAVSSAKHWRCG